MTTVRIIYNGKERRFAAHFHVENGTTYHQLLWNVISPDYLQKYNIRINGVLIDRLSTHSKESLDSKVREEDRVTVTTNHLFAD